MIANRLAYIPEELRDRIVDAPAPRQTEQRQWSERTVRRVRSILTGGAAIGLGVSLWVVSVGLLDPLPPQLRGGIDVWATTLWLCLGSATFFISSRQWATSPRLSCTVAWVLFVIMFGIGEGGAGDVNMTLWAYANLFAITPAVFFVSDYGVRFRQRRAARRLVAH